MATTIEAKIIRFVPEQVDPAYWAREHSRRLGSLILDLRKLAEIVSNLNGSEREKVSLNKTERESLEQTVNQLMLVLNSFLKTVTAVQSHKAEAEQINIIQAETIQQRLTKLLKRKQARETNSTELSVEEREEISSLASKIKPCFDFDSEPLQVNAKELWSLLFRLNQYFRFSNSFPDMNEGNVYD